MKTKILLWGAVLNQLADFGAGAFWRLRRLRAIVLENGDKLTPLIVAVAILKSHFFEFTAKPEKP